MEPLRIGTRLVGPGHPVFIVAELSANHAGSLDHALHVVRAAAQAGADAIKVQTYTADTMTLRLDSGPFRVGSGGLWSGRTLHDLYEEAHTPWDWQPALQREAAALGIEFFSTPFDVTALAFLEGMAVPAHKIASFELVDLELLAAVARTGKPMIVSTGMASLGEVHEAVETIRTNGNPPLVLLKCTSAYPAPASELNLATLPHLAAAFGVGVGLSDHTMGSAAAVAAVAMGACVIEKHFCLSRGEGGPDSPFSMEPAEFKQLVADVRLAQAAIGRVHYGLTETERRSTVFRRSLFVVEDMAAGAAFTRANVRCIRPGNGLAPKHLPQVLGRHATRAIPRGTPLDWAMIG